MLEIEIPSADLWDEENKEFIPIKGTTLRLEHSLVSISKWESKWHKAFLGKQEKTYEETIDYIKCMTLTKNVDPIVYLGLTNKNIEAINEYIADPMTATVITQPQRGGGKTTGDTLTSEVLYYDMIALQIPFECEKWHLNRLIKLIEVCSIKNEPPKKMSKSEIMSRNRALNAQRRAKYNSKG